MRPKISVIIPTYNRNIVLQRAVNSVLNQSFDSFELIIVDDGSTDETDKTLAQYTQNLTSEKIKYLKTNNRGVSQARNLGVLKSQGDWIAFLDSDDEWLPHKLEIQWKMINQFPQYPLIHGEEIWVRKGVRVNQMNKHKKSGGDIFVRCLKLCLISPSAVIMKRSLFTELGGFREDFPVCEDYDLWLKITSRYSVGFIEEPVIIKYGGHDDQLSRKFVAMDYWRIKALFQLTLEKHMCPSLLDYVWKEIIRKGKILLNGYKKYNNLENYSEIETYYIEARKSVSTNS